MSPMILWLKHLQPTPIKGWTLWDLCPCLKKTVLMKIQQGMQNVLVEIGMAVGTDTMAKDTDMADMDTDMADTDLVDTVDTTGDTLTDKDTDTDTDTMGDN